MARKNARSGTYFILKDGTHAIKFANGRWVQIKSKNQQAHARRIYGEPTASKRTKKGLAKKKKGIRRTAMKVMGGSLHQFATNSGIGTGTTGKGTGKTGPTSPPDPAKAAEQQRKESAKANIKAVLNTFFGEGSVANSLADWAWEQIVEGRSESEIVLNLRQRQEYKDRFAGLEQRRQAGFNAITEAEYIQYEDDVRNMASRAGISKEFIDTYLPSFIGKNLSVREVSDRISTYFSDMVAGPSEVQGELERLYNVSPGRMLEFWIDPERGTDLIMRDFKSAQVAAAGLQSKWGELSREQAEGVAGMGVDVDQARDRLSQLAQQRQLMGGIIGEVGTDTITADEQLDLAFKGDATQLERLRKTSEKRKAEFEGGGGAAANQFGVVGLGRGNV